jgi:hypothetical protein
LVPTALLSLLASEVICHIPEPAKTKIMVADDTWKRHHRIVGPSMHQRYLSRMVAHVSAVANTLVDLWDTRRIIVEGGSFKADTDLRLATMVSTRRHSRGAFETDMMDFYHRMLSVCVAGRLPCFPINLTNHDPKASVALGSPLGCLRGILDSITKGPSAKVEIDGTKSQEINPIYRTMRTLMDHLSRGPKMPFSSITFPLYLRLSPAWRKAHAALRAFIGKAIDVARKREDLVGLKTDADCVLDMFVQQERHEESEALQGGEWFDELTLFFL